METLGLIVGTLFLLVAIIESFQRLSGIVDCGPDGYIDEDTEGYINSPGGYQD